MRYSQFDVEITSALHDLVFAPGDSGAAVLVRRKGVPIAFWLQESHGMDRVSADDLARKISAEATNKIVAAAILEELTVPGAPKPLPLVTIAICTKDRPDGVKRLLSFCRGNVRPCRMAARGWIF